MDADRGRNQGKGYFVMSLPVYFREKIAFNEGEWTKKQAILLARRCQEDAYQNLDLLAKGRIDGDYRETSGILLESFFPGPHGPDQVAFAEFVLGNGAHNTEKFTRAYEHNRPVFLCEDGPLSCVATHNDTSADPKFRTSCSMTIDSRGFYFDATKPTDLEDLLNHRTVLPFELDRARALRENIVSNKLSKSNSQPMVLPKELQQPKNRVLVVDQDFGDYSNLLGDASATDFQAMLRAAIRENPESEILVKTHPDSHVGAAGARQGYFTTLEAGVGEFARVRKVTEPVNPYTLLGLVNKVYVATSTLGFEALLAGKEVHCFGRPWYSGWGATHDRKDTSRRKARRTVEELLFIFYCVYTRWCDTATGTPCEIEVAIERLLELCDEYDRIKEEERERQQPSIIRQAMDWISNAL